MCRSISPKLAAPRDVRPQRENLMHMRIIIIKYGTVLDSLEISQMLVVFEMMMGLEILQMLWLLMTYLLN